MFARIITRKPLLQHRAGFLFVEGVM